jgi:hypothetical protein
MLFSGPLIFVARAALRFRRKFKIARRAATWQAAELPQLGYRNVT